jgi:small subunit ribosomal protein S16
MTVKLRFARAGRKKHPFYHIVAADERMPRNGRYLERLGYYNPNIEENRLNWDADRVNHWLKNGAQPTTVVSKLILAEKLGTETIRTRLQAKLQERIDAVQVRLKKEKAAKEAEEKAAAAEAAAAEAPAEEAPVEAEATTDTPAEEAPKEEVKAEETPSEEAPKEEAKAEEAPKEEVRAEEAVEAKAEEKPAEEAKTEEEPKKEEAKS